ncbi:MAG: class I SAM-dependent methyltransferase [Verrucomicrobiaceae bacterium]|nr:class I SAM-dependent methyltransferase [Verrucomicrobiaceae bacterium]
MAPLTKSNLLIADAWEDYQLLDAGDGMKCERWGKHVLVRPDPQILWPRQSGRPWSGWDAFYHRSERGGGNWEYANRLPDSWEVRYKHLRFKIRPTNFKHTGLFPEQAVNWDWCATKIKAARAEGRQVNVLNLFGYTGAASVAAAAAGAQVCHVDAAKGMVDWCAENVQLSGLDRSAVRYIVDDCVKFVRREIKRGKKYDALIMDPPSYGRGAGGELWKLETHLWPLLKDCRAVMSDEPLFLLLNAYTTGLSPTVVHNLLTELFHGKGSVSTGEVGLPIQADGKVLPCGIFGRWEA